MGAEALLWPHSISSNTSSSSSYPHSFFSAGASRKMSLLPLQFEFKINRFNVPD